MAAAVTGRRTKTYLESVAKLAAVLAAIVLLSGCAALQRAGGAPVSDVIPWLPLPPDLTPTPEPSPQAVPVPPGTPMCSTADLEVAVIGKNGAGGHILTSVGFASRGQAPCELDGTPSVTLFDASGGRLPFADRAPFFPNQLSGPALVDPGPVPVLGDVKIGEAFLTLDWVTQPEACPGIPPASIGGARIITPDGDSLTVALPQEPDGYACQGVGVGNFEDLPLPDNSSPPEPAPQPAIIAPATIKAGAQLRYVVSLANEGTLPIDLHTQCFNYDEELFVNPEQGTPPLGGKHLYRLNCATAGILAPGHPMKFAMVIDVPANAAPGSYTLVFNLGDGNAMTRSTRAEVTVE